MTLARDTDRIESERLIFRRIEQADFEFFARIHADPIVARYLGNGRARSIQETRALLETFYETYKSLELGPLAVLRKSDGVGRSRHASSLTSPLSPIKVEALSSVRVVLSRPSTDITAVRLKIEQNQLVRVAE